MTPQHISRGLLVALGLSQALLAAELRVPSDFASIQVAADSAVEGGVITVAKGTYAENVTLAVADVTLQSSGAVVDGDFEGPCLTVTADDVTVSGFTFLNGGDPDGVTATVAWTGHTALFERNEIRSGAGAGLELTGDDATVTRNTVSGCEGDALSLTGSTFQSISSATRNTVDGCERGIVGDRGRIDAIHNHVRRTTGSAFVLTPFPDALQTATAGEVNRNVVESAGGVGLDVTAGSGRLFMRGNRVEVTTGAGMDIGGNNSARLEITGNTIKAAGGDAISMSVNGVTFVARNKIEGAGLNGITLTSLGGGVTFEENRIQDVAADGMISTGPTVRFVRNRIRDVSGNGIDHQGSEASFLRNRVHQAGGSGIRYIGDVGTLNKNRVIGCGRDGVLASGLGTAITDNTCNQNGGDGIDLHEFFPFVFNEDNLIADNVCLDNAHEGIDCTSLNAVITGNRAQRNGGTLGPDIAGAGNDVDGDDEADGMVSLYEDNTVTNRGGDDDGSGPETAQRLDLGEGSAY